MIMIWHQTVSVTNPAVPPDNARQNPQKQLAIIIGKKYLLPSVAARREIIHRSSKYWSQRSCHELLGQQNLLNCKTPGITHASPAPSVRNQSSVMFFFDHPAHR